MKLVMAILVSMVGFSAYASQKATVGDGYAAAAWGALNQVAPALKKKNVRSACKAFGEYQAFKEVAINDPSTNQWDRRNLNYNKDGVVERFCRETANTTDGVSYEEAIEAAERAAQNVGME